ncbi:hypothetical protein Bpfe_003629, partial [Biomphalaria pfeifferi]
LNMEMAVVKVLKLFSMIVCIGVLLSEASQKQQVIYLKDIETKHSKACYLHNKENVEYISDIYTSGDNICSQNIKYEIKSQTDCEYKPFCYIHIDKCHGYRKAHCYCHETTFDKIFSVTIDIEAVKNFSKALIRGTWTLEDKQIHSEERVLPPIIDSSDAKILVYINAKLKNQTQCQETIDIANVFINFIILNVKPEFCHLKLKDLHHNYTVENMCSVLMYSTAIKETRVFELTVSFCNNTENKISFTCHIHNNAPTIGKTQTISTDNWQVLCLVSFGINFLLIIVVIIMCIRCCRKKNFGRFPGAPGKSTGVRMKYVINRSDTEEPVEMDPLQTEQTEQPINRSDTEEQVEMDPLQTEQTEQPINRSHTGEEEEEQEEMDTLHTEQTEQPNANDEDDSL